VPSVRVLVPWLHVFPPRGSFCHHVLYPNPARWQVKTLSVHL
jgi:hypothetical protein